MNRTQTKRKKKATNTWKEPTPPCVSLLPKGKAQINPNQLKKEKKPKGKKEDYSRRTPVLTKGTGTGQKENQKGKPKQRSPGTPRVETGDNRKQSAKTAWLRSPADKRENKKTDLQAHPKTLLRIHETLQKENFRKPSKRINQSGTWERAQQLHDNNSKKDKNIPTISHQSQHHKA